MTGEGMHLPIRLHGGDRVVGLELRELLFRDLGRERAVDRSEKSSRITEMQELFALSRLKGTILQCEMIGLLTAGHEFRKQQIASKSLLEVSCGSFSHLYDPSREVYFSTLWINFGHFRYGIIHGAERFAETHKMSK